MRTLRSRRDILKGRHIHPHVRLIITPGSKEIILEASRSGVLQTLLESGGTVHQSRLRRLRGRRRSHGRRRGLPLHRESQFPGPHGQRKAEIYLSSPATLAASAIHGVISDPREYF